MGERWRRDCAPSHQPPDVNWIKALAKVDFNGRLKFQTSVCRGVNLCEKSDGVYFWWLVVQGYFAYKKMLPRRTLQ
jgi:hypothetical protein